MKTFFFFLISNARNFQRESVKGEYSTKGQMQTYRDIKKQVMFSKV